MSKIFSDRISILRPSAEIKIVATDDGLSFYKTDGTTGADIILGTLVINGSSIKLNSTVTGTPSLNANILVERGASTDAELFWNETTDDWQAGLVGSTRAIARRVEVSVTNANLSGGNYTFTHNLGKYPIIQVLNNSLNLIGMTITHTSVNAATINFNNVLVTGSLVGTWVIIGIA